MTAFFGRDRCPQERRCVHRMIRIGLSTDARPGTVGYADMQTSMHDARAALCLAVGVPTDRIGPLGHDLRSAS
jgi:hypothetical protein